MDDDKHDSDFRERFDIVATFIALMLIGALAGWFLQGRMATCALFSN